MIRKHLLRPERLRRIPPSFSWVDHRLVRDHYLPRADRSAWALYLFLLTVADVQGLSFYSDRAIGRHLKMDSLSSRLPASNWCRPTSSPTKNPSTKCWLCRRIRKSRRRRYPEVAKLNR